MEGPQVGDEITGEMIKVEVIEWWIGYGGCVMWLLRMVFYLKTGDLLGLFHCKRVKERGTGV